MMMKSSGTGKEKKNVVDEILELWGIKEQLMKPWNVKKRQTRHNLLNN